MWDNMLCTLLVVAAAAGTAVAATMPLVCSHPPCNINFARRIQGESAGKEAIEAESKMDWQRKSSAGTLKITSFLGAAASMKSEEVAVEEEKRRVQVTIVASEELRGLVNHRPKSCVDFINADEYRVWWIKQSTQRIPFACATCTSITNASSCVCVTAQHNLVDTME